MFEDIGAKEVVIIILFMLGAVSTAGMCSHAGRVKRLSLPALHIGEEHEANDLIS